MMTETSTLLREASRASLVTFVERMLPQMIPGFIHFLYIDLIAAKIQNVADSTTGGQLVINLPPRHAKSWVLATTVAWYLGNYPSREVLLMAHSQSLANDLAGKVQQVLRSEPFKNIFSNFKFMEGREAMSDFRTKEGGGLKAGGFDTGITGRGADILIIDDSLSAHDAGSSVARKFVCDTFDNMLDTRHNNPRAKATIAVSHRLHENDLSGHLIKSGFDHLKLPYIATEYESYACDGVLYTRNAGELLQLGRMSPAEAQHLAPHVYATQFQQAPMALGSGFLQENYFLPVPSCPTGGDTIISWDIASSTKENASYSVALVFQRKDDCAYLKHIFRERVNYSRLKERALDLHLLFKPTVHLIESASLGLALSDDLRATGANIIDIKTGGVSKQSRLEAVINRINANYVRPVEGIANLQEFFDECTTFPHSTHDDLVDALTQFLNWCSEFPIKPKFEPKVMGAGHLKIARTVSRYDAMQRITWKSRR